MSKYFWWWTDYQKKLFDEIEQLSEELYPSSMRAYYKREVPYQVLNELKKRGYFGVIVPSKYGGIGDDAKVTGACIISEEISRHGAHTAAPFMASMFGGCHQIVAHGSDEQKEKWLPKFAKGEIIGAIVITEPYVGSDAAGITMTAEKDGDEYVINGIKRFISNAGLADIYFAYAKTSDKEKKIDRKEHLSAFIIEKGMPGFSIEKINDLAAYQGVRNGYLRFDDVRVPAENMVGGNGNGWIIMLSGLNFERLLVAAATMGGIKEGINYSFHHTNRRIQFNQPTFHFESNQRRIADMVIAYKTSRLLVYYTAYEFDQGKQPVIEANCAKIYVTDLGEKVALDSIMTMGGDAVTRYYPLMEGLTSSQVNKIGGGSNDVGRIFLARYVTMFMGDEIRSFRRRWDEEINYPLTVYNHEQLKPELKSTSLAEKILEVLAENYRANPGLYMTIEELEADIDENEIEDTLIELEKEKLVYLYRGKKGDIKLVQASHLGHKRAHPLKFYQWFPEWLKKEEIF